jgi:hypothetical protein
VVCEFQQSNSGYDAVSWRPHDAPDSPSRHVARRHPRRPWEGMKGGERERYCARLSRRVTVHSSGRSSGVRPVCFRNPEATEESQHKLVSGSFALAGTLDSKLGGQDRAARAIWIELAAHRQRPGRSREHVRTGAERGSSRPGGPVLPASGRLLVDLAVGHGCQLGVSRLLLLEVLLEHTGAVRPSCLAQAMSVP